MIVKPNDIVSMMDLKKAKEHIQAIALAGLDDLRHGLKKMNWQPKENDTVGCVVTSDLNGWFYKIGSHYVELIMDVQFDAPYYVEVKDATKIALIDKYVAETKVTDQRAGMPALFGQGGPKKNDLPN